MKTLIALLLIGAAGVQIQLPSGEAILKEIDKNLFSKTRVFSSKMVIHGEQGSRTVTSKTWIQGREKAFTEYFSPGKAKGVKMLKQDDSLWVFSPSTDRTTRLSGQMLRQPVMDSDLSYQDMLEDSKLVDHYHAVLIGLDSIYGRNCWVLELTAKTEEAAYHRQKLWVDQLRNIPMVAELYARNGELLKKLEMRNIRKIEDRWFPTRLIFTDIAKEGKGTELFIQEIFFDQPIPAEIFSKAGLR